MGVDGVRDVTKYNGAAREQEKACRRQVAARAAMALAVASAALAAVPSVAALTVTSSSSSTCIRGEGVGVGCRWGLSEGTGCRPRCAIPAKAHTSNTH